MIFNGLFCHLWKKTKTKQKQKNNNNNNDSDLNELPTCEMKTRHEDQALMSPYSVDCGRALTLLLHLFRMEFSS